MRALPTNRAFISFLLIRVCGTLGSTILSVAIGWHLYQATRDPFDLALVGLMQLLPMLLLLPFTGWVLDHYSRKRVLLVCSALQLVVFAFIGAGWIWGGLAVLGYALSTRLRRLDRLSDASIERGGLDTSR